MAIVILEEQYNKVFDSNGRIKPCGREECIKLITLCQSLDPSGTFYGSKETGAMHIENIKKLYNS